MPRTITVKGNGTVTVKPNLMVLSLVIEGKDKKYSGAVDEASQKMQQLNITLIRVGFEKDCVKTVSYSVLPHYTYNQDRKGKLQKKFEGYVCNHRIKIEFDFDSELLGTLLGAISENMTNLQLDISFTVKDKDAINEELFKTIAVNAKKKAEVLCLSAGATLGNLLAIDCDVNRNNIYSKAEDLNNTQQVMMPTACLPQAELQPKDIVLNDCATFVWEIV